MQERWPGRHFAAGERRDEAGHLHGRHPDKPLADGHVGSVALGPLLISDTLFPHGIGDQHALAFIRQVDACGLIQTEAAGLRRDEVGTDADAVIVKEDVTAHGDGLAQGDDAVVGGAACAPVAVQGAISDSRRPVAFDRESLRGEPAVAQPGDRDN